MTDGLRPPRNAALDPDPEGAPTLWVLCSGERPGRPGAARAQSEAGATGARRCPTRRAGPAAGPLHVEMKSLLH